MSVWKYKHTTPTVIAQKIRLLRSEDLIDLASTDLERVRATMMKTAYAEDILAMQSERLDSACFETALMRNFMRTCKKIVEQSPKDVKALIDTFLKKFEVSNVKSILKSKHAGLTSEEALAFVTPAGRLNELRCREILESSKTVRDVVEQLLDLEYGMMLVDALGEYKRTQNLLLFETILDRYVYNELWRVAGNLRGLDKKIAETVLGLEITSANIRIILRSKMLGLNRDQTLRHSVAVSGLLDRRKLEEAVDSTSYDDCLRRLLTAHKPSLTKDYQYMLGGVLEAFEASHSVVRLEHALDENLLRVNLRMLKRYTQFFNIGLILAFTNLKWFEVRNLRTIVKGLEEGIPSSEIEKMLILTH